jgi:ATP adenylyltransferase/5',5'''-P-1,P-4-tetraphosphate phosphorylase II
MTRALEELFARQIRDWPLLAAGIEGLSRAKTRPVRIGSYEMLVRHIPHRIASTTAAVDKESVARRPCFLCAENLPREEEGVPFNDFTIYCNPFPIVERHVTIAHREHRPQQISRHIGTILDLAAALPEYFIVYNGPECGASAPDHLHFQAGSRVLFPIESYVAKSEGTSLLNCDIGAIVFRGDEESRLINRVVRALELLVEVTKKAPEPLVNLAAWYEISSWTVCLFPRSKHRPHVFHTGELTVSPASIDLCGIFVVPLESDFEKVTGEQIASILREVTLRPEQLQYVRAELRIA